MKRAAIISKHGKPELGNVVHDVVAWLAEHGYSIVADAVTREFCPQCDAGEREELGDKKPDFVIVLGNRYGWCPVPARIDVSEFERARQPERLHAGVTVTGRFARARGGVDLGRPGAQQLGDQTRAQAAVRAGDQGDASREVHDRHLLLS